MIAHLGTFDVENFGDLLYPLIFRHLVQKRYASLEIRHYSPLPGHAPQEAAFETYPIRSLFTADHAEPDTLVIGGGDILRTDWKTVAAPYSKIHRRYFNRLTTALGPAGTLRYLLLRQLPGQVGDRFFAHRFIERRMSYPAVGPFLLEATNLPAGGVVAYLSCGVPHEFVAADRDKVKCTFDQARFIYLRDEQSAEKVRRCRVAREIHVAPDLVVLLSDQFDYKAEVRKGRKILSDLGVNAERPVLCFQSKLYAGFSAEEIVERLKRYQRRTDSEVVLLPVGYCHDDHQFLKRLARKSGGTFKYAGVYSVLDIISVIAASDLFVGTSLHGNITAFSFGIPHLFGPLPVDKAEGFLNAVNLPPELKLRSWSELNDRLDLVEALGRNFLEVPVREAKASVYKVIDELFESLWAGMSDDVDQRVSGANANGDGG
jgi:hypothetical protein